MGINSNRKREPLHLTRARKLGVWKNTNSVVIPSSKQSSRLYVGIGTKFNPSATAQT
jgi:hypothetical protein